MSLALEYEPNSADDELRARVLRFLAERRRDSLTQLRVEVRGGVVTLRGRVETFYEKQLSFLCAQHVAGVLHLIDAIEVAGWPNHVALGRVTVLDELPSGGDFDGVTLHASKPVKIPA